MSRKARSESGREDPVAEPDLDEITPVAQDYLKVIWSATEWGDPPITTSALAARFATSAANVSDTVKRLAGLGLVTHEPYKPVRLTPAGVRYAVAMVRRHRLLESFLVEVLGYTWEEVHDEAERLEHAATPRLINRIDALLEHPRSDPHGDPIPRADGRTASAARVVRLSDAGRGRWLIVRVSDADPAVLARAAEAGIHPEAVLDVMSADAFDHDLSQAVWVRPAPGGSSGAPSARP